ncbi:hypothetical protein ACIBSV_48975 [Embleya sp. NPDC050154]|uniref:hypothetical protein n=1 Tax=Embleya sp. NPDC050154 TaxID=3363988 RepID=UPI0037B05C9E
MFPDDTYLSKLGRLTYSLALVESTVLAHLAHLPGLPPALTARKLTGRTLEAIARALSDPANLAKVTEPATRTYLDAAGEELAAAARASHAVARARAAEHDEAPRLHRRPDHTTAGTDITTTWLDHAQAELDDALRRLGEVRRTAA